MIVYHHIDMDGKSAGYICHKYHPSEIEDAPESYIATNYGDKFDKHTLKDDVIIVDISFEDSTYLDLVNACKTARSVTWIDHHTSSKRIIEKHHSELQRIANLTYFVSECASGAALAYSFFKIPKQDLMAIRSGLEKDEEYNIEASFQYKNEISTITVSLSRTNTKKPTEAYFREISVELPKWIQYVDGYDCWKKEVEYSQDFKLGFDSCNTNLVQHSDYDILQFNRFWDMITTNVDKLVCDGHTINRYNQYKYIEYLADTFEWEYEGTTFICKNANGDSNHFLGLINKYEAAILFSYSGKEGKWKYSVYSGEASKFDCSAFCKARGGGGHFHASGFSSKDLIFTSSSKNKKELENIIFLGGTYANDNWREKFIHIWDKSTDKKAKEFRLFNPIVDEWNEKAVKKENEMKEKAKINLFVITPNQVGPYTYAEIVEACHKKNKVYFAVLDEFEKFDNMIVKSLDAIGGIVKSHEGIYKVYKGQDQIEVLVNDIIAQL